MDRTTDRVPPEEVLGADDEGDGAELAPAPMGAPVSSILDQINSRRNERLVNETVKMAIPTWGGDLAGEYRVLPKQFVEETGKRSARGDTKAEMDFIARACVGLWFRDPESGEYARAESEPGVPMRFDRRILQALNKGMLLEGKPTEEEPYIVIRHLMNNNDVAIATHAGKVMRWMTDTSEEVDGQVEGS